MMGSDGAPPCSYPATGEVGRIIQAQDAALIQFTTDGLRNGDTTHKRQLGVAD